jgi:polyhydroxyalkanoate synthase
MATKTTSQKAPRSSRRTSLPLGKLSELGDRVSHRLDPFGVYGALGRVARGWMRHPLQLSGEVAMLGHKMQDFIWQTLRHPLTLAGMEDGKEKSAPVDERFADPLWQKPPHSLVKQQYLLVSGWFEELLDKTPDLSESDRVRARFWMRQWLYALSPSNFLVTNPVALKKAVDTHGKSIITGLRNMLRDARGGEIPMVDRAPFEVGKTIATTPGAVIFRNELMEVIQYTPRTEKVHAVPVVVVPPWINKFYIMDLSEKKSIIAHLVRSGFTVFMVSWRNPSSLHAETTFEDYMLQGIAKAVDVAREVTGAPRVHAIGYCLGGTGLSATMAWYNREYAPDQVPVAHWTTFTTLVDFSQPGEIGVFIDERTIRFIERRMKRTGYLDGRQMNNAFRMLRANNLIWQYYQQNYLYGETPAAFDVLYWNSDATRMPRAMHSFYLREFYLNNKLVQKDALTLGGHPIDLGRIQQPLVSVACEEDHIAPWTAAYHLPRAVGGPATFVLSTSGHILGIINPPVNPPKRSYWMGEVKEGESADHWRKRQQKVAGTWWDVWTPRLKEQCGPLVDPPGAHPSYPKLADAPGPYVKET